METMLDRLYLSELRRKEEGSKISVNSKEDELYDRLEKNIKQRTKGTI